MEYRIPKEVRLKTEIHNSRTKEAENREPQPYKKRGNFFRCWHSVDSKIFNPLLGKEFLLWAKSFLQTWSRSP